MKKMLLLLILAAVTDSVIAQKKSAFLADSMINGKFSLKADTGLFNNKALTSQLFKGNTLTYSIPDKLSDYPLMLANNPERITYSKVDHMPILNTLGKAKTTVVKLQGNSKMPVVGKAETEKVIIDRRP